MLGIAGVCFNVCNCICRSRDICIFSLRCCGKGEFIDSTDRSLVRFVKGPGLGMIDRTYESAWAKFSKPEGEHPG